MRWKTFLIFGCLALLVAAAVLVAFAPARKPSISTSLSHYEWRYGRGYAVIQISNAGPGDAWYESTRSVFPVSNDPMQREAACQVFVTEENKPWKNVTLNWCTYSLSRLPPGTSVVARIMMPDVSTCTWKTSFSYRAEVFEDKASGFARLWLMRRNWDRRTRQMTDVAWSQAYHYEADEAELKRHSGPW